MNSDLKKCCVSCSSSLFEAMRAIDQSATGIALVIAENNSLIGVLTDGDIRRALLAGSSLNAPLQPFIRKNYLSVSGHEGRAEIIDLMRAHHIDQIPIVDDNQKLIGLHLIHDILGAKQRSNWAVIMAGGKGTRLYPQTKNIPKPMLKVAGRPILERLVLHLVSTGIRRIFISINYLAEIIQNHFGNGEQFGCAIEYLHESEPFGTAGSLSLFPETPTEPVLVMNGDLVMDSDLGAMLDFHNHNNYYATIGIKSYRHTVPFGCVSVENHKVVGIEEKPELIQQVSSGIYILSAAAIQTIPRKFFPITDLFSTALTEGLEVGAYNLDGDWVDVGLPQQLNAARGHFQPE